MKNNYLFMETKISQMSSYELCYIKENLYKMFMDKSKEDSDRLWDEIPPLEDGSLIQQIKYYYIERIK